MPYLLDTNIAIHARDGTDSVLGNLAKHDGAVVMSALSLAELERGLYKYPAQTALRRRDSIFCSVRFRFYRSTAQPHWPMAKSLPNAVGSRDAISIV